jgi:alcohol dehydrogenase (NADP+)
MIQSRGYAAQEARARLAPFRFERRDPRPHDVVVEIQYCGVCHSDIHQVRNEWNESVYPMVPGHEIVGRVVQLGSSVKKFNIGDTAGVGVLVDSCRACESCKAGEEQYCETGAVGTYNGRDRQTGDITFGGYSNNIVVDESFVFKIPSTLNPAGVAPLLCAGITTYSPLRHWKVGRGQKVGVIGLGGLGHMALKFAHSLGAHVVQFTTSPSKKDDALRLGADEVVLSNDSGAMKSQGASFDFILDTVSAPHDIDIFLSMLKRGATMALVGLPDRPLTVQPAILSGKRVALSGSSIGGVAETQQMLDYCGEKGIESDIEIIPIQQINEAFERVLKSNVKYRFVIDMASLQKQ